MNNQIYLDWRAKHQHIVDWVTRNVATGNRFALGLSNALAKWGTLSKRQCQAVERSIAEEVTQEVTPLHDAS